LILISGDLYPVTSCGRFVVTVAAFGGIVIVTIIVAVFNKYESCHQSSIPPQTIML
jgi:hypothetical protein